MFKPTRHVRPPISREAYTLQSIEQVFPGGEWVDEPQEGEAEVVEAPRCERGTLEGSSPSSLSLTVIGGTKFDEGALEAVIAALPDGYTVISGGNRGAEKFALEAAERHGLTALRIEVNKGLFGAKANDVHVEQVLVTELESKLVIAGEGVRSKQARSWVTRASWPREVIEIG